MKSRSFFACAYKKTAALSRQRQHNLQFMLSQSLKCKSIMAEEEGFEPPRALTPLSVFKTDPFSQTWVFLRIDKN
jgi:hypothetical protein